MWASNECGVFSTKLLISLSYTASFFGCKLGTCPWSGFWYWVVLLQKSLFYILSHETGVVSVVINHVSIIFITNIKNNISLLYIHIHNLDRTHKWFFFNSFIYSLLFNSKKAKPSYRSKRLSSKDRIQFN